MPSRRCDRCLSALAWLPALLVPLWLGGCGWFGNGAEPLPAGAFMSPQAGSADARRSSLTDQPGALPYDNPRAARPVIESERGDTAPPQDPDAPARPTEQPAGDVSETVRRQVQTPAEQALQRASTQQSDRGPDLAPTTGPSLGQFLTVGAVLTSVNGEPIFADKVVRDLEPLLSARARELDLDRFKAVALDEIKRQTQVYIQSEVEYRLAEKNLTERDRQLARALAMNWRQQQVRQSGGAESQARARARAEGRDFDELVNERYKLAMRQVYFQRKELPKIQITANDLRRFYDRNLASRFSEPEAAFFRVIKIGAQQMGGMQPAKDKIEQIRERAVRGADFAQLASEVNHDPVLKRNRGAIGPEGEGIQRGSYRLEAVEQAVWKLEPGEVTPPIQIGQDFYIAKLETKKAGRVIPFDEPSVQAQIHEALRAEQLDALRGRLIKRLEDNAIIHPKPPHYQPALEMAIQQYPRWRGGGSGQPAAGSGQPAAGSGQK